MAIVLVGGLGVVIVVWLVRSELRERRRRLAVAKFLKQYRKERPALLGSPAKPPEPESRKVTVDELVARVEAEGLAVRLRWDEQDEGPDDDDWPTAVLPRVDDSNEF